MRISRLVACANRLFLLAPLFIHFLLLPLLRVCSHISFHADAKETTCQERPALNNGIMRRQWTTRCSARFRSQRELVCFALCVVLSCFRWSWAAFVCVCVCVCVFSLVCVRCYSLCAAPRIRSFGLNGKIASLNNNTMLTPQRQSQKTRYAWKARVTNLIHHWTLNCLKLATTDLSGISCKLTYTAAAEKSMHVGIHTHEKAD